MSDTEQIVQKDDSLAERLKVIEDCSGPIEAIDIEALWPRRVKGPKSIWIKTWPRVVIVEGDGLDYMAIINEAFNYLL